MTVINYNHKSLTSQHIHNPINICNEKLLNFTFYALQEFQQVMLCQMLGELIIATKHFPSDLQIIKYFSNRADFHPLKISPLEKKL